LTYTDRANLTTPIDSEQMSIEFYDTPSRQKRPFEPLEEGRVRLYSCGPTVWNHAHIGNYRSFLFADVLKRYLRYRGFEVEHVMNLTDVDDRIVQRVNEQGTSLEHYVEPFIEGFLDDVDALDIVRADRYPRATAHIGEMIGLIKRLVDKGIAYERDGSVYFAIRQFPEYGRFAHLDTSGMRDGARVDSDKYDKDDVRDFVLWKAWVAEDGELAWDSPWGRGRPGWHLECSCMSMKYLGETFDIHTGGVDLVFPHHQNEIAQSEGATGKPFARYWMHNEFVHVDGGVMSKSAGNNLGLRELREAGGDPGAYRYFVVTNHYRTTLNFSLESLEAARRARERLSKTAGRLRSLAGEAQAGTGWAAQIERAREGFVAAMDDDLNAPRAMAAVFGLVADAEKALSASDVAPEGAAALGAFFEEVDGVLGILDDTGDEAAAINPELPQELADMVSQRQAAREAKDWARSDELRDRLLEAGVQVTDTPEGPTWTWEAP
jgi:cysteinyl-tRNA synthetase